MIFRKMSKSKPKQANANPFMLPGFDAFSNMGQMGGFGMNFDPSAIDKDFHVNENDIDDDELERELLELESGTHKPVQRRAPPPPKKNLVVCIQFDAFKLLMKYIFQPII